MTTTPPPLPRFTAMPSAVPMTVIGTAAGVTSNPDALIRVGGGLLTYQTIYSAPGPDQNTALYSIPGTYGNWATRAGKGR